MRYGGKDRTVIIAIFILLYFTSWPGLAHAENSPIWELTIEVAFNEPLNTSQLYEPYPFQGWVNYTGVSVMPITVHLQATSDLGEVFLSQYDFTFHLPESIPFDGLINIEIDNISMATPQLTISGYYDQGGLRTNIAPRSYLIPVYYYEENEGANGTIELIKDEFDLLGVCIPSVVIISGLAIVFVRRKTKQR